MIPLKGKNIMGIIKTPKPVKLFIGILLSKIEILTQALSMLEAQYGPLDLQSAIWPFRYTDYYTQEMGAELSRNFISFQKMILPDQLAAIKHYTNELEEKLAKEYAPPARPINLDPGYLSLSKVILATTKDYTHRLYIGSGIYAEVTLKYQEKKFSFWDWTYPDYKSPEYLNFFTQLRERYKEQLKDESSSNVSHSSNH